MHNKQDNEIWVFLSHSNKDYEKVRQVRNLLEEQKFRPLMFFLKCLNDDDEIDDLIKREIKERTRFILCDSKNARNSKWVQKEVDFIQDGLHRVYQTINIDDSIEKIADEVLSFKQKSTVYISYSRSDEPYYEALTHRLKQLDYRINPYLNKDVVATVDDFAALVERGVNEAASNGFLLFLISENSIGSPFVQAEIEYVKNNFVDKLSCDNIIFFTIKDYDEKTAGSSPLKGVQQYVKRVDHNCYRGLYRNYTIDDTIERIVEQLYETAMKDNLPELFAKCHPEGLYWKALSMWKDDHFDGASFGGFREKAASYAFEAYKKGHPRAKDLLDGMIADYPELKAVLHH